MWSDKTRHIAEKIIFCYELLYVKSVKFINFQIILFFGQWTSSTPIVKRNYQNKSCKYFVFEAFFSTLCGKKYVTKSNYLQVFPLFMFLSFYGILCLQTSISQVLEEILPRFKQRNTQEHVLNRYRLKYGEV